ncbi:MAG: SRPBCC domain-containing protein, partial [Nitrososphaeraceae archaeon]
MTIAVVAIAYSDAIINYKIPKQPLANTGDLDLFYNLLCKYVRHLSTNEKRNEETLNTESKGKVTIEGEYGILKFERRLSHPREIVWKAITDSKEIFRWLPDYKGVFDGYKGGAIDLVNTVSGSHVTGNILVCDLHHVFEYEWHISPNQMFP